MFYCYFLNMYRFFWRFMIWMVKMAIFDKNKIFWSCDILFHNMTMSSASLKNHPEQHLAVNMKFFQIFEFNTNEIITGIGRTPRNYAWKLDILSISDNRCLREFSQTFLTNIMKFLMDELNEFDFVILRSEFCQISFYL